MLPVFAWDLQIPLDATEISGIMIHIDIVMIRNEAIDSIVWRAGY